MYQFIDNTFLVKKGHVLFYFSAFHLLEYVPFRCLFTRKITIPTIDTIKIIGPPTARKMIITLTEPEMVLRLSMEFSLETVK